MKMAMFYGGTVFIIVSALPVIALSQANVSRPRTGSPVIPGGAAIPGGQAIPIPAPDDPTPDAVPGLELIDPDDRPVASPPSPRRSAIGLAETGALSPVPVGRVDNIQDFLVSQLQIASLTSIELNQFAAERTSSSDVRTFAETLVSDQQHFWRALERLKTFNKQAEATTQRRVLPDDTVPSNDTLGRPSLTEAEQDKPTQLGRTLPIERQIGQSPIGQTLPDQFPLSRRPPAQSLAPAADADVRYGGTLPPAGGETRVPEGEVSEDSLPRRMTRDAESIAPSHETDRALNRLITIADRAAEHQFAITREFLERSEGGQFDQDFVAMQIADRAQVLAQLRAMKEIGSAPFREIIQTAEELTQGHLASAAEISARLNQ